MTDYGSRHGQEELFHAVRAVAHTGFENDVGPTGRLNPCRMKSEKPLPLFVSGMIKGVCKLLTALSVYPATGEMGGTGPGWPPAVVPQTPVQVKTSKKFNVWRPAPVAMFESTPTMKFVAIWLVSAATTPAPRLATT